MKANFRQPIHLPSNLTRIRVNGTLLSVAGFAAILAAIDLFVRLSGFFYRIFAIVELPEIFPISGSWQILTGFFMYFVIPICLSDRMYVVSFGHFLGAQLF